MPPIFPTINATFNFLAGVFLLIGFIAIKRKNRDLHKKAMIAAFSCSVLFLICYITYHAMIQGVTKYQGEGALRTIYFFILISHTILATLIVPFCIAAVIFAFKKNFATHVKITKWLWPTWIYVSVTGVAIYLMLYIF